MWKTTLDSTSKLTLELRDVLAGGVDLWAFDYPSYYTGADKLAFEKKVVDHFYFRQIGQETVGRFLHMFRAKIREIMPYYIEVYKTAEIMAGLADPFGNVDVTETFEEETTGTASGTNSMNTSSTVEDTFSGNSSIERSGTEDREHRFSNTPQGSISNLDKYLTEASQDATSRTEGEETTENRTASVESTSGTNGTNSHTNAGTIKRTLHKKGNQGVNTYAHDMLEFRETILNVDMMIIGELNHLFLGVY